MLVLSSPSLRANDDAELEVKPPIVGSAPGVFYTGIGQFEVIVVNSDDARAIISAARSVWRDLSVSLSLPADGFNTPISVRLIPAAQWTAPSAFTVTVGAPGLVTVWVRWDAEVGMKVVRQALVHGLVLRQAVAWHGVTGRLTVPLWLVHAGAELSRMRARPALQDMFQMESAGFLPPTLTEILSRTREAGTSREHELAALWLLLQLQAESGEANRWQLWLRGILGGTDALDTLPRVYRGLWWDLPSMELWWQTSFYHQSRNRTLPVMRGDDSRAWLADRSRWLVGFQGRERVLSLGELAKLYREPWVHAELKQRVQQLHSILPVIHPFYANAALSLGRLYDAALNGKEEAATTALAQFKRDALDARELDDTVGAILDSAPR